MNALTQITAAVRQPLTPDEWAEQYKLGALLTGPFDKADPQVALRVAADYGEPATVENIADWLHDETVECIHCNRRWLFTDDDAPAYWNDSGRLCEECAPCTTRGQRDPDGWKLEAGR